MSNKKRVVAGVGGLAAALVIGAVVFLVMSAPSEETKNLIATVNRSPKLVNKNGHVEKVTVTDKDDNRTYSFEADILDNDGNPIGKVMGRRIEGFGTRVRGCTWNDGTVDPDMNRRRGGGQGRGRWGGGRGGRGGPGGNRAPGSPPAGS